MATAVTVVKPNREGVAAATPVAADTVEGNSVPNTHGLHLILENTDVGPHDVVFNTPTTYGGFDVAQHTVTLAAGEERHFSEFPSDVFGGSLEFTAANAAVMVSAYSI